MALTSGTKLGPYEIQSPLGAGGMGEVYRARDTRLDRVVAIKVLATHLSSSPELKQRLEREARAISALNHPRICHLYDIGSQDGTDFLVMEYLEGETLADRLRRGAMPLNEIYKVGIAVAEALALAHCHGIAHRDLKPGNIMLTQSGAKLMDFGLAKPLGLQSAGSASGATPSFTATATLSGPSPLSPLTTAGSIVGTIQYMSPEQIQGKDADARSDIFALGAVLYEMASGKRPFEGKSQISVASAILEKDLEPVHTIQPLAPPAFDHLLASCLQKNPADRFQAAHDVKLELEWIAFEPVRPPAPPAEPIGKKGRLVWAATLIVVLALGVAVGIFIRRAPPPRPVTRTLINPPANASFNLTGDFGGPPVLSPDGTSVAFVATGADGKSTLWVRPTNVLEAHPVLGTDGAIFPFWSPDSRSLGFFADGKLKVVDLNGGSPIGIADAPFGRGGAWGPGGAIVYSPNTQSPLMRINVSGGAPVAVTTIDSAQHTSHRWPFFLPDGTHLIYLAVHHEPSKAVNDALYYTSLDGRENHLLLRCQSNAVYADGYLLFARGSQLMAQPFDPAKGTLSGEPQNVANGVENDVSTWHMDASATDDGLLVLGSGGTADLQLVWVDRNGKQIGSVAEKLTNLQTARLSPLGDRVALQIDTGENDIWVLDLGRGVRTRLTFGPVANTSPVWSPDGRWIAYGSDRNGHANLFRKRSDGSGAEELLLTDPQVIEPIDWSNDGKNLLYSRGPSASNWEIWALPLEGERKPWLVMQGVASPLSANGQISPNGQWLAYTSNESGNIEVYVTAFRGGQGKWQLSANGGSAPLWSKDGKTLYYVDPSYSILEVPVKDTGGALQFGMPQVLVSHWSAPQVFYDVTPDGKRFLLDQVAQQVSQSVTVITNFTAALKR